MKGRFFWVALGLIGISWLLNSIYAYSKQLDEPIFLDHYIDVTYRENLYITFYYLTNKNDTSVIQSIHAGDVSGYAEQSYALDGYIHNNQTFNNHVLRSVSVEIYNPFGDVLDDSFTEMDVVFSDGRIINAPVGHIMIQSSNTDSAPLESISGSSNNSNFTQTRYLATEPLTIESVEHAFQDDLQDDFFIKINTPTAPLKPESPDAEFQDAMNSEWNDIPGLDVKDVSFPLHLKERDTFSVHSKLPTLSTSVSDLLIYISGTTDAGKTFTATVGVITQPYLVQQDVNEIIKKKKRRDPDE